jgi:hypothetical protein
MPSATAAAMTERHGSSGRHRGRAKRCRSRDRKNPLTHRTFSIFSPFSRRWLENAGAPI